jgi:hypothetical protein
MLRPLPSGIPVPAPTDYASRVMQIESGGRADARNPRSSAYGAGQFVAGTWLPMIERYRPDLAQGRTRDEILALRGDRDLNREMIDAYGDENGQMLREAGLPDTQSSRYLAHFLGPASARTVMSSSIGTPLSSLLGSDVLEANPHLRGMTVGDIELWSNRQVYGPSGQPQTSSAAPTTAAASARQDTSEPSNASNAGLNFPLPEQPGASLRSSPRQGRDVEQSSPASLVLAAAQNVMQRQPELAAKPSIRSPEDGQMRSLADYVQKLQKATAAGDNEAASYFASVIASGGAGGPEAEATDTPAPGAENPAAQSQPSRSRAFQRGNKSGSFLDTAYQGLTFGFGDEFSGALAGTLAKLKGEDFTPAYENTRDYVRGRVAREREDAPWTAVGSEIAGGLPYIVAAPLAGGLRTALGAGALYGAGAADPKPKRKLEDLIAPELQTENVGLGEALYDRAVGAAGGALAGAAGHGLLSGLSTIGRAIFPRIMPKASHPNFRRQQQILRDNGIHVTPAESIANPDARRAERIFGAWAGQDDRVTARPEQLYRRLMGMSNFAPEDIRIGDLSYDAVNRARDRFTQGYDRVLHNVNVPTPNLNPRLNAIDQEFAQLLPFEQKANVRRLLDDFADQIGRNRILTGREYQRLRSNLGKLGHQASRSEANNYLAPVYRGIRNALDDAFRRAAPRQTARDLTRLNRQYSGFKILEKAADNIDAIDTMANLARRNRNRLNPEFHDLATAYQDVFLRGGFRTSNTPEGLAAGQFFPPYGAAIRATGTRLGSSPVNAIRNRTGLNFSLPRNTGAFLAGQQFGGRPEVAGELERALGIRE